MRHLPIRQYVGDPLLWLVFGFAGLLTFMPVLRPLFGALFPQVQPPVYLGETFAALWLSHAALVASATLISGIAGIGLGVFVTRGQGKDFRTMVDAVSTVGQTFPPVAVLAIAVPAVGYGALPTFIALTIYGLLPIIENTIAGLERVPSAVREAAEGMGLSPLQILRDVELPLAASMIVAGLRTSAIINIGTATIGSTVGAMTLGTPIIDGLVADKLPYVLQGALVVGWFAVLTDAGFERLDRWLRRHDPRR
jgi:osmoprotectant transport system permease protein